MTTPRLPLAHISWAIADNADRPAVDAFFLDLFGAVTAHEMLVTPETAHYRFDREERLMVIGDTMLIPIAPAGPGAEEGNPLGDMLRRSAGAMKWIGIALNTKDLAATAAWFEAKGFRLHRDRGMEDRYFLISPRQALGMRIEVMNGQLPGDPRVKPGWSNAYWRDEHPLGIVGLQSITLGVPSLAEAREFYGQRLELPELPSETAAFQLTDCVLEAEPTGEAQGIRALTFRVKSLAAAADHLRARGHTLIGTPATRLAITPEEAHGRLIWFTETTPPGWPEPASLLD